MYIIPIKKANTIRDAERLATIKYLKRRAEGYARAERAEGHYDDVRLILRDIADEIESGRHRR
jgi:hypothetical protein